mgnify:CR=1 FL=1
MESINKNPHPLMSTVDKKELETLESMKGMTMDELEKILNDLDEKIKELDHKKSKLALKWVEDNPI